MFGDARGDRAIRALSIWPCNCSMILFSKAVRKLPINVSVSGNEDRIEKSCEYSICRSSMRCGSVQYRPPSIFRRNQIAAERKAIAEEIKKSPCRVIQFLFSANKMVLADSVASDKSSRLPGSRGLQRWLWEKSSKLTEKKLQRRIVCAEIGVLGQPGQVVVFQIIDEQRHPICQRLLNHLPEDVSGFP